MKKDCEWNKIKEHVWEYKDASLQLMSFTNDDNPDVRCVYVKMLHEGEWVSNYFLYDITYEERNPKDFALELVKKFKEIDEEE